MAVHPLLKYKHFDDMRLLHECVSGNYTAGDIVQKFRRPDVRQSFQPVKICRDLGKAFFMKVFIPFNVFYDMMSDVIPGVIILFICSIFKVVHIVMLLVTPDVILQQ